MTEKTETFEVVSDEPIVQKTTITTTLQSVTVEELYDKEKYDLSTMDPGDVFQLLQYVINFYFIFLFYFLSLSLYPLFLLYIYIYIFIDHFFVPSLVLYLFILLNCSFHYPLQSDPLFSFFSIRCFFLLFLCGSKSYLLRLWKQN
jgi:hypothetical protein